MRSLTFNDVAAARELSANHRQAIAAPILAALAALSAPSGHDPAGIPHRAGPVYEEILDGLPALHVAAVRQILQDRRASLRAIEACETARVTDHPAPLTATLPAPRKKTLDTIGYCR